MASGGSYLQSGESLILPSMLWPAVPHPPHGAEDKFAEAGWSAGRDQKCQEG